MAKKQTSSGQDCSCENGWLPGRRKKGRVVCPDCGGMGTVHPYIAKLRKAREEKRKKEEERRERKRIRAIDEDD